MNGRLTVFALITIIAARALPLLAAPPARRAEPQQTGPTWFSGTISYDDSGNIYRIGDSAGPDGDHMVTTFTYDLLSRLVATSHQKQDPSATGIPRTESYSYDSYGNLLSMTLKDGSAITITPDSATNRLKNDIHSPYTVDYDLNGNLTQYNTDTFSYDALGTLTRQNHDAGAQNFYLYNADDERVGFKDGGTGQWNWTLRSADDRVLRTYTSSDIAGTWTWSEDYLYAGGRLLAAERPSGRRHFHLDHLGSPRLITDNLRNTIAQHDFAPFGTELTSMRQEPAGGLGNADVIGFTGHERDFTGGTNTENEHYLDYMHARYYSAIVGRFLTVDPAPDSATRQHPQSWNKYSYAWNDPLTLSDPTGKHVFLCCSAEEKDPVLQLIEGSLDDPEAVEQLQLYTVTRPDGSVELKIAGDQGFLANEQKPASTLAAAINASASIVIFLGQNAYNSGDNYPAHTDAGDYDWKHKTFRPKANSLNSLISIDPKGFPLHTPTLHVFENKYSALQHELGHALWIAKAWRNGTNAGANSSSNTGAKTTENYARRWYLYRIQQRFGAGSLAYKIGQEMWKDRAYHD